MSATSHRLPYLAAVLAIALYSVMDATMKHASLAVGAYSATFWRCVIGFLLVLPLWLHEGPRWPAPKVLVVHVKRGIVGAGTALTFFLGLVRLPLAEAIAISFIAPLIALFLAAVLLNEKIGREAIGASVLGLGGVLIIALLRVESGSSPESSAMGIGFVLISACLYAWNLILQRQQALVAGPREVAVFQTSVAAITLAFASPWFLVVPDTEAWAWIGVSAALAMGAVMLASWAYGRAEAQVLVPIEYTAFLWAALMGWLIFRETLTVPTVAGAVLIVAGCWLAAPKKRIEHIEQTTL